VRRIILNADDFGLTVGVNSAIVEAHLHGVLTSATLMANAAQTAAAIDATTQHPNLAVGCHIVLVDGTPIGDPACLPSLIRSGSGKFHSTIGGVATRALTGRMNRDQIESEATAQFRRLQAAGLSLSHFDTHKHAHMFPAVLEAVLRAARACGVPAVRNPFEPTATLPSFRAAPAMRKRILQTRMLRRLQPAFRRLVRNSGLKTTDGTVGIADTGTLDEVAFARIISCLPEGTWELVLHPGYNDVALQSAGTRLRESREIELRVLTSRLTRDLLDRAGVQRITYRDL
jgi:hopanoid biosynthesis associated protein HpnK